jgi:hypothetical protein
MSQTLIAVVIGVFFAVVVLAFVLLISSGRVFLRSTISHRELEPFLQELG